MGFVSGYRANYKDWVPEEDRQRFFRIEETIGKLEDRPLCQEAAPTLFWQYFFYLKNYYDISELQKILKDSAELDPDKKQKALAALARKKAEAEGEWANFDIRILNRVHDILRQLNADSGINYAQDKSLVKAFVQLHLATVLLRARRLELWGSPELVDEFLNIGAHAFEVLPSSAYSGVLLSFRQFWKHLRRKGQDPKTLFEQTSSGASGSEDNPETLQRRESLSAVAALFFNECFYVKLENESYEEALAYFAKAVALWSASQSAMDGELDMLKAVDCCECLLSSVVSSWQMVAESCDLISESITYFPESDDLDPMLDVTDATGEPWAVINYWRHVGSVAETSMSPSELKQYSEAETRTRHEDRLKRDFLWDVWEYLELQSRRELTDAEIIWHEAPKQGGTPYAVPSRLKLAFEYELQAMVFGQVKDSLRQILNDQGLRRELKLTSKDTKTLGSREMANLLEQAIERKDTRLLGIRVLIKGLRLSSDDTFFLCNKTQLPRYLKRLAEVRRKPEHRIVTEQLMNEIREIRNMALGIGQPSYLRRLGMIKRKIASGTLT